MNQPAFPPVLSNQGYIINGGHFTTSKIMEGTDYLQALVVLLKIFVWFILSPLVCSASSSNVWCTNWCHHVSHYEMLLAPAENQLFKIKINLFFINKLRKSKMFWGSWTRMEPASCWWRWSMIHSFPYLKVIICHKHCDVSSETCPLNLTHHHNL